LDFEAFEALHLKADHFRPLISLGLSLSVKLHTHLTGTSYFGVEHAPAMYYRFDFR
jgi:hypothetical protein